MFRRTLLGALALGLVLSLPATAQQTADTFALPNGWQPEGIDRGPGNTLFVGSIPTGRVLRLDPATGQTTEVVPQHQGRAAIGVDHFRGRLFVAGGATGRAFIYDAETGRDVRNIVLTASPTFVNDVSVTRRGAWFTDSRRAQLYRVGFRKDGSLALAAVTVPVTGDLKHDEDPDTIEANGIEATPDGRTLLVVQSTTGLLFRVNPSSGASKRIPLTGGADGLLPNADGILLRGRTLYVVQNRLNKVAVVRLGKKLRRGVILREITHPAFDVPTTVARLGDSLYLPNARFDTPPGPDTPYAVVRVPATP